MTQTAAPLKPQVPRTGWLIALLLLLPLLLCCGLGGRRCGVGLLRLAVLARLQLRLVLRQALRAQYQPRVLLQKGWRSLRRTLALIEQLPHDLGRLLRRARHGQLRVQLELAHLRRVGDQLNQAANRISMALVIAALIVGSSIVMTVPAGPTLLGLPAFGLMGFVGAVLGGLWLLRSIWRSSRQDEA